MKKSFRYNHNVPTQRNGKGNGIHTKFLKSLLCKDSYSVYWSNGLKMPKPENQAELKMLSKFIFGTELTVRFDYCDDELLKVAKDLKFNRLVKLIRLNGDKGKDYINEGVCPKGLNIRSREKKMILLYLRYFCNQPHNDYYDSRFNRAVFDSCYELDSIFWRHVIGEVCCGGISSSSYGQVEITSIKEHDRVYKLYQDINTGGTSKIRPSFEKEINKLIEQDKQYDNENNNVNRKRSKITNDNFEGVTGF